MEKAGAGEGGNLPIHRTWTEREGGTVDVRRWVPCSTSCTSVTLEQRAGGPHLTAAMEGEAGPVAVSSAPPGPPRSGLSSTGAVPRLEQTRVGEVMTRDVCCVSDTLRAEELEAMLVRNQVSALPVVDGEGRLLGLVSRSDRPMHAAGSRGMETPGASAPGKGGPELVVHSPVVLDEQTTLPRAAAAVASSSVRRAVVVSADGRVVGILTALDIARWVAGLAFSSS
jgi:CBS domain-containing protein